MSAPVSQTTQATQELQLSAAEPQGKVAMSLSLGLIVAVGSVAILALHVFSFLMQAVITPIIFGVSLGIAAHIVLRGPKESLECAEPIIAKIPVATKAVVDRTPAVIEKIIHMINQACDMALQYIRKHTDKKNPA